MCQRRPICHKVGLLRNNPSHMTQQTGVAIHLSLRVTLSKGHMIVLNCSTWCWGVSTILLHEDSDPIDETNTIDKGYLPIITELEHTSLTSVTNTG